MTRSTVLQLPWSFNAGSKDGEVQVSLGNLGKSCSWTLQRSGFHDIFYTGHGVAVYSRRPGRWKYELRRENSCDDRLSHGQPDGTSIHYTGPVKASFQCIGVR
jgi:hypothetical protein